MLVQWAARVARPLPGTRILAYHSIVPQTLEDPQQMTVPVGLFEAQMDYLRHAGFEVLRLGHIIELLRRGEETPPRTVAITFDDGFADNYELALPVLMRLGYSATTFVTASVLLAKDGAAGIPSRRYLTLRQAREMLGTRVVEFGCHGMTHRRLRGLSDVELLEETAAAKASLEDALGTQVALFAYPFGSYDSWDRRAVESVRAAGYRGAVTSIAGTNLRGVDVYLLRRCRVSWQEDNRAFDLLLKGAYDWYAWVQRLQHVAGVVAPAEVPQQ